MDKHKIIDRLASNQELEEIYLFTAQTLFNDNNKFIKGSSVDMNINNLSDSEFLEQLRLESKEEIGKIVIVKEFKDYKVKFYSYNQLFINKDKSITITINRIINRNGIMNYLNEEDTEFHFEVENKMMLLKKYLKKSGRPRQPTSESINSTLLVQNALLNDDSNTVDFYCKRYCLPKTTYYRVSKWLNKNTQLSNNKIK